MTDAFKFEDSDAIQRANELLESTEASAAALVDAQREINEETRRLNATTAPDPRSATSIAEHKRMTEEMNARATLGGILDNLYRRLGEALARQRANDAVNDADADRQALEKAVARAEELQRQFHAARADAQQAADYVAKQKAAAGRLGLGKVGAPAELVERVVALGIFDSYNGSLTPERRFRREVEIEAI